jgi:3-oxoacyl-[acyl-carrier protein] reductase
VCFMSRVALITGASRGIGLATAERLAAEGARVIGVARNPPKTQFPGRFIALDLADAATTEAMVTRLAKEEPIDMLVNNAGLVGPAPFGSIAPPDLTEVLDLNLRPALQAAQALAPGMKERRWGRIVNISSLTVLGAAQRTSYAAAKAAMISFTRSWALELAEWGITVNCVAPGATDTELFRTNNPPGSLVEQRLIATTPLGRVGRPQEIAAAICYFLSEDASFATGQTLFVDGGLSIGRRPF